MTIRQLPPVVDLVNGCGVLETMALLAGVVLAAAGGELFVRGTVGLAAWARISAGIAGATVAAFATSAPELSVAVNAALEGRPAIGLGGAIGSNVVNIGLVLGVVLVIASIRTSPADYRRNLPFAVVAPVLTALLLLDGGISRFDAAALLAVFAVWMLLTVNEARRERSAAEEVLGAVGLGRALTTGLVGLVALVLAGRLFTFAAVELGQTLGIDDFIVGASLVALGTSTPELATAIVARLRGHDEVGLGTIIGSNIFNNLWIVGVAGLIQPIDTVTAEVMVGLVFGVVTVLLTIPNRARMLTRGRGVVLLAVYAAYVGSLALAA